MRSSTGLCVLATGLFALMPEITNAQTLISGAKGGIDFSALPNAGQVVDQITKLPQPTVDTSSRAGFIGGGFVRFVFNDRLAFEPELMFVMKGVKLTQAASAGTISVRLNYLEFPLLARYAVPTSGPVTPFVLVGPNFGVKASTGARLSGGGQTIDQGVDSAIRSFDAGLTFAGGLEKGPFLVEFRYTLGLTDIANDTFVHADSLKNRVFAIMAGIKLK